MGFDSKLLAANTAAHLFRLARCSYDVDEQRDLLRRIVSHTLETVHEYVGAGGSNARTEPIFFNCFLMPFLIVASTLKGKNFREEQEWRLISHSYPIGHEKVLYRSGPRLLVPYILVPLAPDAGQHLPIRRIVIAPTEQRLLEGEAVRGLVTRAHGSAEIQIDVSEIPYRG